MFDIRIPATGDEAEAETPAAAIFAARTLAWEAWDHHNTRNVAIIFGYDGEPAFRCDMEAVLKGDFDILTQRLAALPGRSTQ